MSTRGSDGYILASAIGVLLTISIVAASLVGTSSEALSRLRRSETEATHDAVLQSALTLITSQLPLDPRRRVIDLEGEISLTVLERPVQAHIRWESNKLDVNQAGIEAIRQLLTDRRVPTPISTAVLTGVGQLRGEHQSLRLLSDLGLSAQDETCLTSMLTVFGGRSFYEPADPEAAALIGQPTAGSRLSVELSVPDPAKAGLAAVVLMTDDPLRPVEVLDWKRTTGPVGEEVCYDAK